MMDLLSQLLFLARFLCFMAVFYLALHKIAARLIRKPNSKVLWFFGVVTAPLTRPVRAWTMSEASDHQVLARSLLLYGCLWLCLIALSHMTEIPR
jgi:hypothetical protein